MDSTQGGGMPAPSQQRPVSGRSGSIGMGLNAAALAVSVLALVLSIAIAGPTGPKGDTGTTGSTGAQGPQGPAGPGTIMASTSLLTLGSPVTILPACTHYTGAEVIITLPGPGAVVVTATTTVGIDHNVGNVTEADLFLSETATTCILNGWVTAASISANQPTGTYTISVPLVHRFPAAAAGTYTFYLNGEFAGPGTDQAYFLDAGIIAVFYPS